MIREDPPLSPEKNGTAVSKQSSFKLELDLAPPLPGILGAIKTSFIRIEKRIFEKGPKTRF